jgi:hypothetical protein
MRSVRVWLLVGGLILGLVPVVTVGPGGSAALGGHSLASEQVVGRRGAIAGTVTAEPATVVSAAVVAGDTPVGRQVTWLVAASHRLPLSVSEIDQHLGPALLASLRACL